MKTCLMLHTTETSQPGGQLEELFGVPAELYVLVAALTVRSGLPWLTFSNRVNVQIWSLCWHKLKEVHKEPAVIHKLSRP